MSKSSKRIISVALRRMYDDSPDLSTLGEYSATAKTDYAIDRAHKLDCIANDQEQKRKLERIADFLEAYQSEDEHLSSPNGCSEGCEACEEEHSYFEAAEQVRELAECDGCAYHERNTYRFFNGPVDNYLGESSKDIRKYVRQDFERAEALNRGDWSYIGVKAEALIETGSHVTQRISSGGLWGVESDSDASYFAEIQRDELAGLKAELIALGFSRRSISTAFKSVQERED